MKLQIGSKVVVVKINELNTLSEDNKKIYSNTINQAFVINKIESNSTCPYICSWLKYPYRIKSIYKDLALTLCFQEDELKLYVNDPEKICKKAK